MDILEQCGLAGKANRPAASLTLLDRKRLELARALATDPAVLLLDEVAGGLTERECVALVELVRDVKRKGVSIIWIEHVVHALIASIDRWRSGDGDPQSGGSRDLYGNRSRCLNRCSPFAISMLSTATSRPCSVSRWTSRRVRRSP
jgi:ABC-type protease/lipase transport system fused ATPase/permease subunit